MIYKFKCFARKKIFSIWLTYNIYFKSSSLSISFEVKNTKLITNWSIIESFIPK